MTVPCTCQIPDPVVVNGECLVCYGQRPKPQARQLEDPATCSHNWERQFDIEICSRCVEMRATEDNVAIAKRLEAYFRSHGDDVA